MDRYLPEIFFAQCVLEWLSTFDLHRFYYITESPSTFLEKKRRTPSRLLCEHHGKSTDKVTRPGLHSEESVPSHFSSLLRPEETPPRSAQGQGTFLEEATSGGCLPPPFASFHEAEKRSRVPVLIFLSLSSAIPTPIETSIDGIPARSSLSIS